MMTSEVNVYAIRDSFEAAYPDIPRGSCGSCGVVVIDAGWAEDEEHWLHGRGGAYDHTPTDVNVSYVGSRPTRALAPTLYHWAPTSERTRIEREGLQPDSEGYLLPFRAYSATPVAALAMAQTDLPLDLWVVETGEREFSLTSDGAQYRSIETVPALYLATREAV